MLNGRFIAVGDWFFMKFISLKFVLFLLCLSLFVSLSIAQSDQKLAEELRKFDTFYEQKLKEWNIVGSSFRLIHETQVLHKKFYGLAHVENNYPVDEETIYHWASITKTLTGTAIMQLRDRGKLKLEDPITKYVPEIRQVYDSFGSPDEITIRQLLSHTAGFRLRTFPWAGDKDWQPSPTKWAQIEAMIPYTEVEFKPGNRYQYSNLGIVFLGQVIERITGEDYEVYVDKNILRPLEMYRSFFDTTPFHLQTHRSHSYQRNEDGTLKPFRFDMDTGITVSNGGLNAPLPDMVKYVNFLMGDKDKQPDYDEILRRTSLEEMWQPIADSTEADHFHGRNYSEEIGLTFFLEKNYGTNFIGHSGGQNGFTTHFYLHPATRTAYLIAFNTWTVPTKEKPNLRTSILDRTIKEYLFQNIFPLFKK